ncbi:SDR family oxidoreductase [Aquabacterium sp. J223]|uniref:SDR family oxidoreductase n=1 Tax=Aquabacterium sp. J223 TaxID=2898431 RepID=UPI0021AD9E28|nr:SDR family oxidoreductase [Aquabacterium sp. J223]UUX95595.1 SDR family oxidoreductase [Aquabacterium sp. J223]
MADDILHKPLNQQVIVITGASSGIGLATARMAAREGARLVLAARSEPALQQIADELSALPACEAVAVACDVGRREDVDRVAATALERFGRIDTWVNDAGVAIYGRLEEVSEADSRRLFDTNFWGVVNGSLAALPHLRRHGGALVNVGSEVSDAVIPLQGMYSASKHAVKGFTDALRVEVEVVERAPLSITLIQPTAVDTPYPQHARNYMDREPKLPTPQIDPEDVARAILKAATHGGRDVKVGAMSTLDTLASKVMPGVADKMAALQDDRQQADEPPRNPEGALFRPSGGGTERGRGGALHH